MLALAHPAGDLQAERRGSGELRDQLMLHRVAGSRAVKVDDVGPLGAGLRELPQRLQRIGVIRSDQIEPPLLQAHGRAADQVHRGIDDHARNASRKREPAAAERSGWNCAPSQLFFRTTAGISRP